MEDEEPLFADLLTLAVEGGVALNEREQLEHLAHELTTLAGEVGTTVRRRNPAVEAHVCPDWYWPIIDILSQLDLTVERIHHRHRFEAERALSKARGPARSGYEPRGRRNLAGEW